VSFDYPADWFVFDADASEEEGADGPPGPSSRALVGLDQLNRVVVRGAPGEIVVTSDTFDERRAEVEDMVEEGLLARAKILAGPDVITVGMQPALRWRVTTPSSVGYVITTTVVVLFRGARQYTITCSHIPSFAEVIEDGCSKIIASAEFTYQAPL
jgi:hypothetical protein